MSAYSPLRLKTNDPEIQRLYDEADAHRDSLRTGDRVTIENMKGEFHLVEPYNRGFCYYVSRDGSGNDRFGVNIKDMTKVGVPT